MRSKGSVGKGHTLAPEGYKGTPEPKPCGLPNITSYPLTIREASSSSSFLACGSPSILIRLLFSLSGGTHTDTSYRSFILLTSRQGLWRRSLLGKDLEARHLDYHCSEAAEEVNPPLGRAQWGSIETGEIASSPWSSVRADLCHTRTCTGKYCGIYRANCSLVRARRVIPQTVSHLERRIILPFYPKLFAGDTLQCYQTSRPQQGFTVGHILLPVL